VTALHAVRLLAGKPAYAIDRKGIVDKSLEFGRTIRELEDFGYFEERLRVRKEWKDFSNRTIDKQFRVGAIDAYYDEYCREPTDEEYAEVEQRLRRVFGDPPEGNQNG
jgi:hypothetical protein